MLRKIIRIDTDRCNGCGLCASACHEGAIEIVDGKARLAREHFCDGLGDCLPACPMNAISFEMREAPAYDEQAVLAAKREREQRAAGAAETPAGDAPNALDNWPVQLKLVSSSSPVFLECDLLIAADCTAYAYGNFHRDFVAGRTVVIGCPKLDGADYAQKLTELLAENSVRSVTLTRMFVPCCGGMEYGGSPSRPALLMALQREYLTSGLSFSSVRRSLLMAVRLVSCS